MRLLFAYLCFITAVFYGVVAEKVFNDIVAPSILNVQDEGASFWFGHPDDAASGLTYFLVKDDEALGEGMYWETLKTLLMSSSESGVKVNNAETPSEIDVDPRLWDASVTNLRVVGFKVTTTKRLYNWYNPKAVSHKISVKQWKETSSDSFPPKLLEAYSISAEDGCSTEAIWPTLQWYLMTGQTVKLFGDLQKQSIPSSAKAVEFYAATETLRNYELLHGYVLNCAKGKLMGLVIDLLLATREGAKEVVGAQALSLKLETAIKNSQQEEVDVVDEVDYDVFLSTVVDTQPPSTNMALTSANAQAVTTRAERRRPRIRERTLSFTTPSLLEMESSSTIESSSHLRARTKSWWKKLVLDLGLTLVAGVAGIVGFAVSPSVAFVPIFGLITGIAATVWSLGRAVKAIADKWSGNQTTRICVTEEVDGRSVQFLVPTNPKDTIATFAEACVARWLQSLDSREKLSEEKNVVRATKRAFAAFVTRPDDVGCCSRCCSGCCSGCFSCFRKSGMRKVLKYVKEAVGFKARLESEATFYVGAGSYMATRFGRADRPERGPELLSTDLVGQANSLMSDYPGTDQSKTPIIMDLHLDSVQVSGEEPVDVGGGGDCLFLSVAHLMDEKKDQSREERKKKAREYRRDVADHILEPGVCEKLVKTSLEREILIEEICTMHQESISPTYLAKMKNNKDQGGSSGGYSGSDAMGGSDAKGDIGKKVPVNEKSLVLNRDTRLPYQFSVPRSLRSPQYRFSVPRSFFNQFNPRGFSSSTRDLVPTDRSEIVITEEQRREIIRYLSQMGLESPLSLLQVSKSTKSDSPDLKSKSTKSDSPDLKAKSTKSKSPDMMTLDTFLEAAGVKSDQLKDFLETAGFETQVLCAFWSGLIRKDSIYGARFSLEVLADKIKDTAIFVYDKFGKGNLYNTGVFPTPSTDADINDLKKERERAIHLFHTSIGAFEHYQAFENDPLPDVDNHSTKGASKQTTKKGKPKRETEETVIDMTGIDEEN